MATYAPGRHPEAPSNVRAVGAWSAVAALITAALVAAIGGFYWFDGIARSAQGSSSGTAATTTMPGMTAPSAAPAVAAGPATEIARAATDVPAPITRTTPTTVRYDLKTVEVEGTVDPANGTTYTYWTFDGKLPGPMLRVMQGDTVEIHVSNPSGSQFAHSIDLHAVTGPGGGSGATQTMQGKDSTFSFKALNPGLYIYHCATAPVATHVANGMFGMILVEPPGGLPKVDREYYVMQSEIYTDSALGTKGHVNESDQKLLAETPTYYVFNGRVGALSGAGALHARTGETARIYFGVGTFKSSAFHVIGTIFDSVYSDGGIGGAVERNVGVVNVPPAGTSIVTINFRVPGTFTIVDHALQRVQEGASGQIVVDGPADPSVFSGSSQAPAH